MNRWYVPARALLGAVLAAALVGGCGGGGTAAKSAESVPSPMPSISTVPPSGSPSPIGKRECQASVGAMSPMPGPGHMPSGSTMHAIQKRRYLIAGVDQDSYAWGYPNPSPSAPRGEEYQGFDIDMLHAVAQAIFGDPDAIRFVPVGQDYRLGASYQGIVDIVASSITITCDRKKQVRFSVNYFDGTQGLLVPTGNNSIRVRTTAHVPHVEGLKGGKVCTVGTTTSVQNLRALEQDGHFTVVLARNWSDCLVLIQQGSVQAVSTDTTILAGLAAEDPYLKLAPGVFSDEPHGLAMPLQDPASKDNEQFVSFVNGVIARLKAKAPSWCPQPRASGDGSCWAAMYRTWIEPQLGKSSGPPAPEYSP
ncbi:transporter substrate-binding domain-containing protein [Streptomyces sp. NPDC086182]|uniref:transporter substrate-binding domain-containing protein n=1 Tax=Streptomyces sp. NPDC086182 TaxID=3155058 RepID=UPI003417FB62